MKSYLTPAAFRKALLKRNQNQANIGQRHPDRTLQLLLMERFLARLCTECPDTVLKGGLAMEYRLGRARTTKDADLRMMGDPDKILPLLIKVGQLELGDWLSFVVDPELSEMTGEGVVYRGLRLQVVPQLGGSPIGTVFGLDISFGDPLDGEPERVQGSNFFEFIGLEQPEFRIYPRSTHIAEKLHAYTLPRTGENTRLKDLPDIALLANQGPLEIVSLRRAIERTFHHRGTHEPPTALPPPPSSWAGRYRKMAMDEHLPWADIEHLFDVASRFLDPVLSQLHVTCWNPAIWSWENL